MLLSGENAVPTAAARCAYSFSNSSAMSCMAFFTRALVFSHAWVPSLFSCGAGPVSVDRYF